MPEPPEWRTPCQERSGEASEGVKVEVVQKVTDQPGSYLPLFSKASIHAPSDLTYYKCPVKQCQHEGAALVVQIIIVSCKEGMTRACGQIINHDCTVVDLSKNTIRRGEHSQVLQDTAGEAESTSS